MGTSSQFHYGAQLKFYPHSAQRYYTLLDWVQENFVKAWRPLLLFQTIRETLLCNSTNFRRLTLSQYGKAFSLSAAPVAY